MKWKDLKIGTKIMMGFCLISLVALIIGLISLISLGRVNNSFKEVAEVRLPSIEHLLKIQYGLEKIRVAQRTLLIPNISKEDRDRQYVNIDEARKIYQESWKIYEPLPQSEKEAKLWKEFVEKVQDWRKINEHFEATMKNYQESDIDNPYDLLQNITQFKCDHYELETKIFNAIETGQLFDGGDDHTQCNFGKWIATLKTKNPVVNKAIADVLDDHKELHQSVKEIKDAIKQGNKQLAFAIYKKMHKASTLTFEQFNNITNEVLTSDI